jgi:hypothetical protein
MKAVARALYNQPVIFLAAIQAGFTALAATDVITTWIPLVTLGVVAAIQRSLVTPDKPVP